MYISPFSQQMCVSIPSPWNERAQSTQLWSRWTEVEYMSLSAAPPIAAENWAKQNYLGLKSKRAGWRKTWCRALLLGSAGMKRLCVTEGHSRVLGTPPSDSEPSAANVSKGTSRSLPCSLRRADKRILGDEKEKREKARTESFLPASVYFLLALTWAGR